MGTLGAGAAGLLAGSGVAGAGSPATPPVLGERCVFPLPFAPDSLRGISAETITWHHDTHYAGYVARLQSIDEQLARSAPGSECYDPGRYAGLKRDEAFAANGALLHEVYFGSLGGHGSPGDGPVEAALTACFGSIPRWLVDMRAVAMAASGWALLCLNLSDGRLHNYLVDRHQLGAIWGAAPVIAVDMFDHAYYRDFGSNRGAYVEAFFENLHWGRVNARYVSLVGGCSGALG